MASNAGTKIFREFFRDSPCRMAYLLKSNETYSFIKSSEHPRNTPKSIRLNRTQTSIVTKGGGQFSKRDEGSPPIPVERFHSLMLSKTIKQSPDNRVNIVRQDPSRKHNPNSSRESQNNSNKVGKKIPHPSTSRKPGGCRVCLQNDPIGFLLNEIDHIRDRLLGRPESISFRQALLLVQDIRNRVDAIVLPVSEQGSEREPTLRFIGGRVESFAKRPTNVEQQAEKELTEILAGREKMIAEKGFLQSALGNWIPREDE